MSVKRDEALKILNGAVPEGTVYQSNAGGPPYMNTFFDRTWTNHTVLMADYIAGGIMTACNGFVNTYALRLGITGISNWFQLKQSLEAIPEKAHAWVPATAQAPRPQTGDILKHKILHVDVALGFNGNILRRVAAGQGDGSKFSTHPRPRDLQTRSQEYDVLRRVDGSGPYNWQNLEGWLDIDLYFGSSASTGDVPDWLVGWWISPWRDWTYYYYFDRNHEVKWTLVPPVSTAMPPVTTDGDTGDFTVDDFGVVKLQWRSTGSVETLRPKYASATGNEMTGMWNGQERFSAVKM